jgi:phenylacetate-CoA ligase
MIRYPLYRRIYWTLRGFPAQRVLSLLEDSQWWPRERLEEFRNGKLRMLIEHCYAHVPYYREIMDGRGLKPSDIATSADLPKLPVLTKDIVRLNLKRIRADNIPDRQTYETRTGGTTGEPMRIRRRGSDSVWQVQSYVRGFSWGGLLPNMPRISLFGGSMGQGSSDTTLKRLFEKLLAQNIFLPAFELTRRNVGEYVARIRDSKARHLVA